jgi:hypothetical protein
MTRGSSDTELRRDLIDVRSDLAADRQHLTQAWDAWEEVALERQDALQALHRKHELYVALTYGILSIASTTLIGLAIGLIAFALPKLVIPIPVVVAMALGCLSVLVAAAIPARRAWKERQVRTCDRRWLDAPRRDTDQYRSSVPSRRSTARLFGSRPPGLQVAQFEALKQAALEQGWTVVELGELARIASETPKEKHALRGNLRSAGDWIALHEAVVKRSRTDERTSL